MVYKKLKTAQEIQDDIFRRMSADEKVTLGSKLWRPAKALDRDKINYGIDRSPRSARQGRSHGQPKYKKAIEELKNVTLQNR